MFGEPSIAWKGVLIYVAAGSESCVERIRPVPHRLASILKRIVLGLADPMRARICRAVLDLSGEEPAISSLLKCNGNVLITTTIEQIAEAHVFAEKSGLGIKHMASLIENMFPRPPHTSYSSKMVSGDYAKGEVCTMHSESLGLESNVD